MVIFMKINLRVLMLFIILLLMISVVDAKTAVDWNNEGVTLERAGNYEEALEAFNKAIQLDPQFANAWYRKGLVLNNLGRKEEGKEALNKAYELDPTLKKITNTWI